MFYPARMSSVLIGVHNRWLSDVIAALHQQGEVEILDLRIGSKNEISFVPPEIPRADLDTIARFQFRIDRIVEILEGYEPEQEGFVSSLFSSSDNQKLPAYSGSGDSLLKKTDNLVRDAEVVLADYDGLKKNQEESRLCAERIADLSRLKGTTIDLSLLRPSHFTTGVLGYIKEASKPLLDAWIAQHHVEEMCLYQEKKNDEILVFCIASHTNDAVLSDLVHEVWFFQLLFPPSYAGMPEEMLVTEEERFTACSKKDQEFRKKFLEYALKFLPPLRALKEELMLWRERIDVCRKFGESRDVSYLCGWVRQKDEKDLHSFIQQVTHEECFFVFTPADPNDNVPVRYDNPSWLAPFELLTTTFSRPRYNELDPTPFFAPAYLLFFGLMLGDAGYGLIITLVGWLLYRGPGRGDPAFRDMSYILLCSGLADIILGTIQGGWFGDLLPRFFHIQPPFVLIEPLHSPILLFQVALIIGTIHINLGILLGLWENVRLKRYRTAFQEQIVWFILEPAAAVLLIQFFGWMSFSSLITNIATAGAIFGLAVLFLKKGPMGFFSLTGFLGDWLSYVRILALALATGGIAMTINILSEMIASVHPLMIIPAILFCIAGQLFNLAIQALGSVIHALRLHYIEFFGRFYSGGGREFVPFREHRLYTSEKREDLT